MSTELKTTNADHPDDAPRYIAANGISYVKVMAFCAPKLYERRIRNGRYRVDDGILHKRCSRCTDYWPADSEFFYVSKGDHDGLFSWCKACYQAWRYPQGRLICAPSSMPST